MYSILLIYLNTCIGNSRIFEDSKGNCENDLGYGIGEHAGMNNEDRSYRSNN
jgi:hypothetical protein